MIFFIRYKNKEYNVRVERVEGELRVQFQDEAMQPADIQFLGNACSYIRENRVFASTLVGEKGDFTVWRPDGNIQLKVESEYKRIVSMLRGASLENEHNVYAKMPGKIVKLMAQVGTEVTKGAPLLVMEAMKMENEIRSAFSGTIKNVCVTEGQAVETGALLIELEPSSPLH